jgi:hypothetical protein
MTQVQLPELLADWQRETRELLAALHPRQHPEGVLPSAELDEETAAIRRFRWVTFPRETRKQRYLWPVLAKHLFGDTSVLDDLRERKQLFELELVRLRWSDERSQHFDHQLRKVLDDVEHYVECESGLLPRIATEVPGADQQRVADQLTAERGWPPIQPHPDLPETPWAAKIFGPVTGVLDRARDRFGTTPG